MNKIERLLEEEKDELNNLNVPENMELRLRNTLNNIPNKKTKSIRVRVAALIIVVLLIGYNIDTLAYYGKKLIGFDNVMNGTLRDLNELGKGQLIDKHYTFNNGVKVTLDGIMLDDNNMVVFYTIYSPDGKVMDVNSDFRVSITDFRGMPFSFGGQGKANEEETELKWVLYTRDIPKFYERTISFNAELNENGRTIEKGEIKFKIDRDQAVGKSLRIAIDKKVELDQRSIKVESLVASPTSTVIKGQIQNIFQLGKDYISGERFRPESLEIKLIANGKEVSMQGSSMSTDMGGSNFEKRFDALPHDIEDLELRLTSFGGDHDTKEMIKLVKGESIDIKVLEQDISIDNIYEKEGSTYITITSDENLAISRVYLNIDGKKVELEETIPGDYEKIVNEYVDEDNNNIKYTTIKYTRTLRFIGTGEDLELDIQRIRFSKTYDKIIYSYKID